MQQRHLQGLGVAQPGWISLVVALSLILAWPWPSQAQGWPDDDAPSTLLLHATIPDALSFAGQTARQRGWTVRASGPAALTFEQPIVSEPDGAPALLRIQARFLESPAGVTVTLQAHEIYSGPEESQSQDVTRRYRDHLFNALDALAAKWGLGPSSPQGAAPALSSPQQPPEETATRSSPVIRTESVQRPPADLQPPPDGDIVPNKPANVRVGIWAYYAERYAESQGCRLGELGAVLESERGRTEVHRVHCQDGRRLLIRCSDQGCGAEN